MDMGATNGPMAGRIQEVGEIIKWTDMVHIHFQVENIMRASTKTT